MPLLDMKCLDCGHVYEALKSISTVDPSVNACPQCGGKVKALPVAGILRAEKTVHDYSPLELQHHMEAKRHYETDEMSQKFLSGEARLIERGPSIFRPQCPEHLRKRLF